jgi:membrane protein implicated in regulation of membrane protease activity
MSYELIQRAEEVSVSFIKFVPGFIAAIAAFVVFKLIAWIGSLWLQVLVFLGVYAFVAVSVEMAMRRYGQKQQRQ